MRSNFVTMLTSWWISLWQPFFDLVKSKQTHYSLFHNIVQIEWRTETLKLFPFDSSKHTFKKKEKKKEKEKLKR